MGVAYGERRGSRQAPDQLCPIINGGVEGPYDPVVLDRVEGHPGYHLTIYLWVHIEGLSGSQGYLHLLSQAVEVHPRYS